MPKCKDRIYYERRIGKELKRTTIFIIEHVRDPATSAAYINRLAGVRGRNIKEQYENLVSAVAAIKKEIGGLVWKN